MQRQFEINHSTAATLRSQQWKIQQMWGIQACMPPCAKHLAPQDVQRGRRGQHIQRGRSRPVVLPSVHASIHDPLTFSSTHLRLSSFAGSPSSRPFTGPSVHSLSLSCPCLTRELHLPSAPYKCVQPRISHISAAIINTMTKEAYR